MSSSSKVFIEYYKALIDANDQSGIEEVGIAFSRYIDESMGGDYPCFLTRELNDEPDTAVRCKSLVNMLTEGSSTEAKALAIFATRDGSMQDVVRCPAFNKYNFADSVFTPVINSIYDMPDNQDKYVALSSGIYENSKYYMGRYSEGSGQLQSAREQYRRAISQFIVKQYSHASLKDINAPGCESLEILRNIDTGGFSYEEAISICKIKSRNGVEGGSDAAFSLVASRIFSQPANFLEKDEYIKNIISYINFETFNSTAKVAALGFYLYSSVPGIILRVAGGASIIGILAGKAATVILTNVVTNYLSCITKKLAAEAKNLSEHEKNKIYRAVIIILWGVEMKNYEKPLVTIIGRQYNVSEAELNIKNAYSDIASYFETQLSDPEKNQKYMECL